MKNDFENSDKRLQEKMDGFRMTAPEGAWAGIEQNIGGRSKRRGGFFYLWMLLLFIGIGGGTITFLYFSADDTPAKNTDAISLNVPSENTTQKDSSNENDRNNTSFSENDTPSIDSKKTADISETSGKSTKSVNATEGQKFDKVTSEDKSRDYRSNSNKNTSNATKSDDTGVNTLTPDDIADSNEDSNDNQTKTKQSNTDGSLDNSSNNTNDVAEENTSKDSSNLVTEETTQLDSAEAENKEEPDSSRLTATVPAEELAVIQNAVKSTPPPVEEENLRPSWSLEGGLDVSSFNLNHSAINNDSLTQALNASYSQNFGQAAFLRVNYQPFQRFSFHSGLEYRQSKATQDYISTSTSLSFQYDTTGWYFDSITQQQLPIVDTTEIISETENLAQFKSSVSQISIPFGVMFHVPLGQKSELGINATGLVGIRAISSGEVLFDQNGNSIAVNEAYRQLNFSARTALRYTYFVGSNSAIYVEPYVGFGLNNRSNTEMPFSTRFRNSGVRVGFRYNF